MKGELETSGSLFNVPEDVVIEILSYLPAKTLMRFACVCKSWHSLIKKDHQFAIKNYLYRTASSSSLLDNVGYMFKYASKDQKLCLYSFTKSKTVVCPKKFECVSTTSPHEESLSMAVSNSCHGIVCFSLTSHSQMLLCNPSIREAVLLPPRLCTEIMKLGVGFDSINSDYKVVTIMSRERNLIKFWDVDVYSARCGRWRNLPSVSSPLHDIESFGFDSCVLNANGRMCNWLAFRKHHTLGWKISQTLISFDMVEEALNEIPMPKCDQQCKTYHEHHLLSSSRCQACLSCFQHGTSSIDIWVLHGTSSMCGEDQYMWSREISIRFPEGEILKPVNFWINDKELFVGKKRGRVQEILHYDVGTKQLKPTGWQGSIAYPYSYAEGVVSVKGLVSSEYDEHLEDKDNHDETDKNCVYSFREVGRSYVQCYRKFQLI